MKIIKIVLIFTMFMVYFSHPVSTHAMEFRLFYQTELELNIIVGQGRIKEGDADRFLTIANSADRDPEGHIIMVLNSLGGSVSSAYKLADAMSEVGVFTLVPDSALCASACASIVYVAGIRRDLLGDGRLGFHTCYLTDGKTIEKSSYCNEEIAQRAINKGLGHASVSLFVNDFGPDEMAWVGRDVACTMLYGMCRPTLNPEEIEEQDAPYYKMIRDMAKSFSPSKPSFDCNNAKTTQEIMICNDRDLARLDRETNRAYKGRLLFASNSNKLREEQRSWLRHSRNACSNKKCLVKSYDKRIKELTGPSYDCNNARTPQEIIICNDRDLSRLDREINRAYKERLLSASNSNKHRDEQRSWLRHSRDACSNKECLVKSYNNRISELTILDLEDN